MNSVSNNISSENGDKYEFFKHAVDFLLSKSIRVRIMRNIKECQFSLLRSFTEKLKHFLKSELSTGIGNKRLLQHDKLYFNYTFITYRFITVVWAKRQPDRQK
jgi:hypothetical protein